MSTIPLDATSVSYTHLDVYKRQEVSIVIGGGNFWRGRSSENIDRTKADQIGMLATVMNCIYVSEIFRSVGLKTQVYTPFVCGAFTPVSYTHLQR